MDDPPFGEARAWFEHARVAAPPPGISGREAIAGLTSVQAGWAFGVPPEARSAWLDAVAAAATPARVWVLRYSHKHGDDVGVHLSREIAWETLAGICRYNWADHLTEDADGNTGCHDVPPDMSDDEVITRYFAQSYAEGWGETYELAEKVVQDGTPQAARMHAESELRQFFPGVMPEPKGAQ